MDSGSSPTRNSVELGNGGPRTLCAFARVRRCQFISLLAGVATQASLRCFERFDDQAHMRIDAAHEPLDAALAGIFLNRNPSTRN